MGAYSRVGGKSSIYGTLICFNLIEKVIMIILKNKLILQSLSILQSLIITYITLIITLNLTSIRSDVLWELFKEHKKKQGKTWKIHPFQ